MSTKGLGLVRGKNDRRGKDEKRILWMSEESYLYEQAMEDRRLDVDAQAAIIELLALTKKPKDRRYRIRNNKKGWKD